MPTGAHFRRCHADHRPDRALSTLLGLSRVRPGDASLLWIEEVDRGAHYTALLDTIDHRGATKLHAGEREQLLEAADVLLFGEPDSELTVRSAEVLIEALETSERWSVESCDQLREHLYGCGAPTGAS